MDEKINLKEKVQHGSPMFPINIYGNVFDPDSNTLLPHWHDEFEIICLESGSASFTIDGNVYNLLPRQFLFINCGSIHSGQTMEKSRAFAIVFNLKMLYSGDLDICKNKYLQFLEDRKIAVPNLVNDEILEADIFEIIKVFRQKEYGNELMVKGILFKIFYRLFNKGYVKSISFNKEFTCKLDKIKAALEYININFSLPLKIDDLSKTTNLSKFYFCHLFKQITHLSVKDYINKLRVEKAIELLRNTDMNISEVALEVGFNNISYFIKVFKEYIGMTPLQYKRKL